ncbi:MAG: GWxTD domain-containing protein [Acidobacteriota bacterium]
MKGSIFLLIFALSSGAFSQKEKEERIQQQEEKLDHFEKWLTEDVVYIITQEEREVFEGLTTPEEKERFIEQFWRRRDPDPSTSVNEFKEEHYRRISYANEHFHSGIPGWKTDRGRIYIQYGPPDEISGKPAGGMYVRPPYEGGGTTSVFPFEVWRYKYLEGIGPDVEMEFVDPHQSGEFRLARDPLEKDAALYIPNSGLTLSEAAGLTDKRDRILARNLANQKLSAGNPYYVYRAKDQPFERLLLRSQLDKPPRVKYTDLQTIVQTRISYDKIAFQSRLHYLRVSGDDVLAPLTILIPNRELGFEKLPSSVYRASVQLYGEVWDVAKNMVYNFEDELSVDFTQDKLAAGQKKNSIFQRYVPLKPGRYVLKMVIKDVSSEKVSTADQLIVVPRFPVDSISASSMILADAIIPENTATEPGMFTLGNVKVIPSVDYEFGPDDHVFVYFQLYQMGVDQQTLRPKMQLNRVLRAGKQVALPFYRNPRLQIISDGRVVVIDAVPVKDLPEGHHTLDYEIEDLVTGNKFTVSSAEFRVHKRGPWGQILNF